jgi:hypothetical protein
VASQIYRVLTHLGVGNHVVNSSPGMAAARAGPTVNPGPLRRMGAAQRLVEEGAITRLQWATSTGATAQPALARTTRRRNGPWHERGRTGEAAATCLVRGNAQGILLARPP